MAKEEFPDVLFFKVDVDENEVRILLKYCKNIFNECFITWISEQKMAVRCKRRRKSYIDFSNTTFVFNRDNYEAFCLSFF